MKAIINEQTFQVDFNSKSHTSGTINSKDFNIDAIELAPNKYHILKNNKSYTVEVVSRNTNTKQYELLINGRTYNVTLKNNFDALLESMGLDNANEIKIDQLVAPMPGLVVDILVKPGQSVAKGEGLLLLEAMKMENVIKAPIDVVVKEIKVEQKEAVEKNQVLIIFE